MPPAPGNGRVGVRGAKPKPKPVIRNADTGDTSRSRPAPAPIIKKPVLQRPFQAQQQQAQQKVRVARRALPAPTLAQPPVVGTAGTRAKAPAAEPKMSRQQVATFLRSQAPVARHAREQIVTSIRKQIGDAKGQERVTQIERLMDEIATDPRLSRTRAAIRHYTALEQQTAQPQTRDQLKAGPPDRKAGVGFATVNLTAVQRAGEKVGEKIAPGLKGGGATKAITKNALSDIAHLPIMGAQTTYEVGMAAKEAAGGDTKRARELAKSLLDGVYGHLARGDIEGAVEYFREHPIYAVLEVRGGKGFVGRGAGAVMRSGVAGERARAVASTRRRDLDLSGEGARVADRQHYSPDVLTKLFQVAVERGREGAPRLRDHRLRRRADFESDTGAAASRTMRADEGQSARRDRAGGRLDDVVGLVVQGVVRPAHMEADLRKELARLDHAHATAEFSTGAQRRQNRATAQAIRDVLGNRAAMNRLGDLAQSGRANVRAINDLEGQAVRLGALTPERADRAALFPGAQAHIPGAEYSDAPFRAARGREVAAGRALRGEATRLRQKVAGIRESEQRAQEKVAALAAKHRSERGREAHLGAPVAAYYVGTDRFTLRRDAVDAARRAGVPVRDIRRVATTVSEAKRVGELSGARRAARAITQRRRAAEAELRALNRRGTTAVPHRTAFEAARAERRAAQRGGTQSLNAAGRQLPNDEIRRAIGEDVAYLPHHTRDRGARAYYQTQFAGRRNLDSSQKRTGAAFERGAVDSSREAVTEHRIRLRGIVNRIVEHDRIISSISITGPRTPQNPHGMLTWDQAEKMASNARDNGARLVPYRAVPGSYDQARIARIANDQAAQEMPDLGELVGTEFAARLRAPAANDRSARNVVLIPEVMANQLREQQRTSSAAGAAGNVLADTFRRTVLPFSTKWLTGNVVEAGIRLGSVGAGVNAHRIGRKLLREIEAIDREQALRVRGALTGGLLYGNRGLTVRRVHEHFQGTALERPAAAVGVAARLPVVRQLGQVMKGYTDAVFNFNRTIESAAQTAALGKHAKREMQEMTGSWLQAVRAQDAALQDVARGMLDTRNVHDAARYIDQTLGQYSRFSPSMRRFIQQAAPFLPWYLNAARFVFWTLPAKHPIKTGIYAAVASNLQADYDASHANLPPGDLRGDIVTDNGTVLPFSRYSPFGAFGPVLGGGDEQLTALVDPLFPQFKSAALAAFGLNFAGRAASIPPEDRGDDGRGVPGIVRATMAFNSLLEAFIPVVGIGKRVREGGSTGYDNSTIFSPKTKPDTKVKGGAANRILNPFRPSPIKGNSKTRKAAPVTAPTPTAAPPVSLEDELLNNLDESLGSAQAQQQLEDDLLNNLYGDG